MPSKITPQQADVGSCSCCFHMSLICPISGLKEKDAGAQALWDKGTRLFPSPSFLEWELFTKNLPDCSEPQTTVQRLKKLHRSELIICIKSMGKQEDNILNPGSDNTPILINFNQIYLCLANNLWGESSYSNFNPNCFWERAVQKLSNKWKVTC